MVDSRGIALFTIFAYHRGYGSGEKFREIVGVVKHFLDGKVEEIIFISLEFQLFQRRQIDCMSHNRK